MWNYVKKYLYFAIPAALFMVGEVSMDVLQPGLMRHIVDEGVLHLDDAGAGGLELILKLGLTMICLTLFGGLCGSMNNVFVHLASQNIGNEIRKDCFRRVMAFSFPQMDRFGTGSLITRVTNDITQVQSFVAQFVRGMIRTTMLMGGSIFCMFRLNRQFGLMLLCAFPLLSGVMVFCLRKAGPLLLRLQEHLDQVNSILQEDVTGIRVIKACVREGYEALRFGKANDALVGTQLHVLMIFAFMNPMMNALMYLVVVLLLLSGSYQVSAGMTTPGTIMAAITYTTQMLNGILSLVMLFQTISKGIASWKRVREILNSQPELLDGDFEGGAAAHGSIEFQDVSFGFPESGRLVLRHIDLSIQPGETVAIMGSTGCGKSALVNLIPRFYDVTEGSVKVDGVDVRSWRQQALRDRIAVASQKSELFSRSIEENIAWGLPGVPGESLRAAAVTAQADGFISAAPNGYGTMVAERGASLSGGQKQRISIARTVLKPAEIMIFDDSTSALDLKTEADLYAALNRAKPETTKIIVAQRIASVRHADRIVVLRDGRIDACGTHEELLKSCRTYQDIYHSQIGEEAERHG